MEAPDLLVERRARLLPSLPLTRAPRIGPRIGQPRSKARAVGSRREHRIQGIGRRLVLALAAAAGALAMTTSAASAAGELPQQWDPRTVAVNHEDGNTFLLRPGQILAGPGDAPDVQRGADGLAARPSSARSA